MELPPIHHPRFTLDSDEPLTVGYLSDVEGNVDYFRRYMKLSHVLEFEAVPNADPSHTIDGNTLRLKDGCMFVFGGDCFDKGAGDIRLGHLLADLKDRYPDRVHLLLG